MCDGHTGGDFGCLKCTDSILERKHGWIECKSTSFPGKVYYFHTLTRCSTWQRPVPRTTQLPRYKKYRDSKSLKSPTDADQGLNSSSALGVSGTEGSLLSSEVQPSEFELHARRMQIYLQKNTDYNLALKYDRGETLRDKLLECYRSAKSELAKQLKQKMTQKKTTAKIPYVKPKINSKPINPVKTVRECNGIKTISYDPIPRELPTGVIMPNLSETSIDSFTPNQLLEPTKILNEKILRSQDQKETIPDKNHNFGRFVLKDLNLSESENTVSAAGIDFLQS